MRKTGAILLVAMMVWSALAAEPPRPYGPTPNAGQIAWHELEFYGFMHFTINTFTGCEWGNGNESPELFNPTAFDATQIVASAKVAGMKGLIITAKHHDGFCLWPSKYTEHSVKNSPWKGGQGDVVKEMSEACRAAGLKFGVYLSPWDRNHAEYGRPAYVEYYRNQVRELMSNYGPLFEFWIDGANGGDGYYGGAKEKRVIDRKQYYDWPGTWALMRSLQTNTMLFSDGGPDVRWIGNERGQAGDPCWATLNAAEFFPGESDEKRLICGDRPGTHWLPGECDVSIRPGWFYHKEEDSKVKTGAQLMDLYFSSVGRGASFLLSLAPDRRGQIPDTDVAALKDFRRRLDGTFADDLARKAKVTVSNVRGGDKKYAAANVTDKKGDNYWATDEGVTNATLTLEFKKPVTFNVVRLREFLPLGQRVEAFTLEQWDSVAWHEFANATSIGSCRLVRLTRPVATSKVRLRAQSPVSPALAEFALYLETK